MVLIPRRLILRLVPKIPPYTTRTIRISIPALAWPGLRSALNGKTVVRAGFGIYHGAAQNDDLNAGLESDRFTLSANFDPSGPGTPLLPAYQQEIPDLSSLTNEVTRAGQHPRALQRQGRRDLYVETWGLTIDHELPANFLAVRTIYWFPWCAVVFARSGELVHHQT